MTAVRPAAAHTAAQTNRREARVAACPERGRTPLGARLRDSQPTTYSSAFVMLHSGV